ncbi:MAG: 30S ribosomal protein S1 [Candidatus Neomarinimicrobiota bacterium]|jgi:small subunit ribosomal protein S1|nr:30S ribosomal protein S1 [Candidatus Neomarinimicrobiota bacterium]
MFIEETVSNVTEIDDKTTEVDNVENVNVSSEKKEIVNLNYLDKSLLNVKTVKIEDLESYEDLENVELDKMYLDSFTDIKEGEVATGTIVNVTDREVFIDIGFKSEGIVPKSEFPETPIIGEEHKVFINSFEDHKGHFALSKEKAVFLGRWNELKDAHEKDEIIKGTVIKRIKGGMVVDLNGVFAFLPGSQIDVRPITNFDDYISKEIEFKIVKVNETRKNIVVSRKVLLEVDLHEKRQEIINQLETGMVLEGTVKNITDFGAFIDLGGIDGLLHITDITWGRINHPSEVLELDKTVTVKVIDFDVEKVRVSLGMKQLDPEPWEGAEEKYPVDSLVKGKIVNMMNYGVFVELEKGVEGLIHVSEMSWTRHIKNPNELYKLGDEVEAKILSIDKEEKKISLGIKQLTENPWNEIENKYPVGSINKGVVRNLTQFGAFVELEDGIDGLVHISDMSWTKNIRHPKDFLKKGDHIDVKVLEASGENRRLSLGIKQIEEDPWDGLKTIFTTGKQIEGKILRILDKGIIFTLEHDLEGIVPLKRLSKQERADIKSKYKQDDSLNVIVQEIDQESKKVILMLDMPESKEQKAKKEEKEVIKKLKNESTSDKIEVPQDIIDSLKS